MTYPPPYGPPAPNYPPPRKSGCAMPLWIMAGLVALVILFCCVISPLTGAFND